MDSSGSVSSPAMDEQRNDDDGARWWQRGLIYQVYPRSFLDRNGDGIGDLAGILAGLEYLRWLGVDAVWISPIYPSPMADFGYDVSDYMNVHPMFGTLQEFDELVASAHRAGLKIILDLVPNHTSEEHPWFVESRASRDNPKRNWYMWRDAAPGGGLPNNWLSTFGGAAWEWDPKTEQYYYHAYLKQQPDLNWRNLEVQAAMHQAMRFWLDRGVDGFRIDVIWHLIKDDQFRANPPNPDFRPGEWPYRQLLATYTADRPEVHDVIAGMRNVMNEYEDRLMIGEIYLPVERLITYYGTDSTAGVHLPFNFQLIEVPWHARTIAAAIDAYEAALPPHGWPNWVLGNHDKSRIASRVGPAQARIAAMLLMTLRGTPTMYYGDEIGMHDVEIPPESVQDPWELNVPGFGVGRDPQRTPMQWDESRHAGFTTGEPWLPVAPDYPDMNVSRERHDPTSILALYRRLIALRKSESALTLGIYRTVASTEDTLLYLRKDQQRQLLVALNFSAHPRLVSLDAPERSGRILLSTQLDRQGESISGYMDLRANEGIVAELAS